MSGLCFDTFGDMGKSLSPYRAVPRRQREAFHTKIRVTSLAPRRHTPRPLGKAPNVNSFVPMKHIEIDEIYQKTPLELIPWNIETPPAALVALVDSQIVTPCRAIDLGCGVGNYAVWLASRGFQVTGVDSAPTAIKRQGECDEKRGRVHVSRC